jgi:hypothetical protein
MADNVFQESAGTDPDAGLPNVLDLVATTVAEVQKDPMGFIVAGLIPGLSIIGLTFVAVFGVYGIGFLGALPGIMADDEDLAALGGVSALLLAMMLLILVIVAVTTPIWASMYRAVWALLVRGEKLTIGAPFSTIGQDLVPLLTYTLLSAAIVSAGVMFCYLPGILAQGMLMFAWPAIVVHRMPVGRAIQWSVSHAMTHPGWHLGLWAVSFAMSLVLPYFPIVGYMLLFTIHPLFVLLAYRACAGDGEHHREAEAF